MTAVLRVGAKPEPFRGAGVLLDGTSPVPRPVSLAIDEDGPALILSRPDASDERWPLAALRQLRDQADREEMVLRTAEDDDARLVVREAESRRILAARAPALHRRPPVTGTRRLILWGAAAILSVAAIIWYLVPLMADQLAEYLPPEGERVLGERTLEQIRGALDETGFGLLRLCDDPAGDRALAALTARLTDEAALPYDVTARVLDLDMVNALALPGGIVVLFRGLIEAAETPEEVAAVLAHELGHVAARDPTRMALRTAGSVGVLGLLLGDFAGGTVVLFLTERLIRAEYSRAAEAGADAYAHGLLAEAGLRPSALADMFDRLRAEQAGDGAEPPGFLRHFASHPALGDRIAAARTADAALSGPSRAALAAEDWRALRSICQ
ncbi:M48 family metallopeptidase [Psychromarinibacter sp. C21-152]|uniref:M48 family metallopeptidase n=1 Tax=Psychromarinibacter sediminicola TaxID=3033385 RepID=A0AAE3T8J8_9RHOB|nr:M48 family metallopeptidase [Psychromarinibacter sediminicola]MDF0600788.1 M48 family metallopeptidase [Psychromarinibacter sediminicola]